MIRCKPVVTACGHSDELDTQTAHILCNTGLVIVVAVPFNCTRNNESMLLLRVHQVLAVCTQKFNMCKHFFSVFCNSCYVVTFYFFY